MSQLPKTLFSGAQTDPLRVVASNIYAPVSSKRAPARVYMQYGIVVDPDPHTKMLNPDGDLHHPSWVHHSFNSATPPKIKLTRGFSEDWDNTLLFQQTIRLFQTASALNISRDRLLENTNVQLIHGWIDLTNQPCPRDEFTQKWVNTTAWMPLLQTVVVDLSQLEDNLNRIYAAE